MVLVPLPALRLLRRPEIQNACSAHAARFQRTAAGKLQRERRVETGGAAR